MIQDEQVRYSEMGDSVSEQYELDDAYIGQLHDRIDELELALLWALAHVQINSKDKEFDLQLEWAASLLGVKPND